MNSELTNCFKKISETIDKNEKSHPDWFNHDNILEELNKIFKNNVGEEYQKDKLEDIYKDGRLRYPNNIPPGYEDAKDKEDDKKYGDLILWYQIIDKAKESQKPIIFVTRDKKEDWWWKQSGNTIGPRYELKKEILTKANVDFHMYDSERFLEYAFAYYKQSVDKEVLKEIKKVKAFEERNFRNYSKHRTSVRHDDYLIGFFIQQGVLAEELLNISKRIDLDGEFLYIINRNRKRLMDIEEKYLSNELPLPVMLEELFMLRERLERTFRNFTENNKINKEQFDYLKRYFDRITESYVMLLNYVERQELSHEMPDTFYNRIQMDHHRIKKQEYE